MLQAPDCTTVFYKAERVFSGLSGGQNLKRFNLSIQCLLYHLHHFTG